MDLSEMRYFDSPSTVAKDEVGRYIAEGIAGGILFPDKLIHEGIKGQKWGVKHGPPYPLKASVSAKVKAKAKSGDDEEDSVTEKTSTKTSSSNSSDKNSHTKTVSEMTDQELRDKLNRMNMEKQYSQLMAEQEKAKVSKGEKFAKMLLNDIVLPAAKEVAKEQVKNAMKSAISSAPTSKKKK